MTENDSTKQIVGAAFRIHTGWKKNLRQSRKDAKKITGSYAFRPSPAVDLRMEHVGLSHGA